MSGCQHQARQETPHQSAPLNAHLHLNCPHADTRENIFYLPAQALTARLGWHVGQIQTFTTPIFLLWKTNEVSIDKMQWTQKVQNWGSGWCNVEFMYFAHFLRVDDQSWVTLLARVSLVGSKSMRLVSGVETHWGVEWPFYAKSR